MTEDVATLRMIVGILATALVTCGGSFIAFALNVARKSEVKAMIDERVYGISTGVARLEARVEAIVGKIDGIRLWIERRRADGERVE